MYRWIISLSLLAGLGSRGGAALAGEVSEGRAEAVERIETVVPVTACGVVEGSELIAIKSKASGRVQHVYVQEGQMVNAGAFLVQLEPCDEQHIVERLQAELDRTKAGCEQARIRLQEARQNRPLDVEAAENTVEETRAMRDELQINVDLLRDLSVDLKNQTEDKKAAIALRRAAAVLGRAEVDLRRAQNNLPILIAAAEQDLAATEASMHATEKQLDEARERLSETTIRSPIDGMVYSINVRRGEVIQSGTFGLSGGAVLAQIADVAKMYVTAHVNAAHIGTVRRIAPEFAQPGKTRVVSDEELFGSGLSATPSTAVLSPGRRVNVTADAYPDEAFEGAIEKILPEPRITAEGGAFDVRIRLIGTDVVRLLSLPMHVDFKVDRKKSVLRVRNEAVVKEGRDAFVYIPFREPSNTAEREKKIKVQVGLADESYTEIISGLATGDRVWLKRPQPPTQSPPQGPQRVELSDTNPGAPAAGHTESGASGAFTTITKQ